MELRIKFVMLQICKEKIMNEYDKGFERTQNKNSRLSRQESSFNVP